jgi:hypothetical protein
MNIVQQISNNPITGLEREVYLISEFCNSGQAVIYKDGNISFPNSIVEAQYQIWDYSIVNGVKKYSNSKSIVYVCSDEARIVPVNAATGELLYVEDQNYENFQSYPTEKRFVESLKYNSTILVGGQTMAFDEDQETILRMFINNLDTRNSGSVFNKA